MKYGTVSDLEITNDKPCDERYPYCVRISFWVESDNMPPLVNALTDEPIAKLLDKEVDA